MKTDPHHQRRKYRPLTLVSGSIRFIRIFAGVPCRGGVKRQWRCRQQQFSLFTLAVYRKTVEIRPALWHRDTESLVGFPSQNAWPWMNLNGYFTLNSAFTSVRLASETVTFESILRKNKSRWTHIIQLYSPRMVDKKRKKEKKEKQNNMYRIKNWTMT